MKYSVLFASTATAYAVASTPVVPAYGASTPAVPVYGASTPAVPAYGASTPPAYQVSSAPVYGASSVPVYGASSMKSSSSKDTCYGTITPGYGSSPVTITKQGQSYPTCVSTAYGTCAKWGKSVYVSTTIKDYNNKAVCVTNVNQKITIYSTKTTSKYPAGSTPTGTNYKKDSTGCYYQVTEIIQYAPYGKLGSNALTGFSGSGICKNCCYAQPVWVKTCTGGKCTTSKTTQSYGVPTPKVTTYATPGVYTVPSKAMTVTKTVYYAAQVTKTATAGQTCVYGGKYAMAKSTGKMVVPYGAVTTKVVNGKTTTKNVVKTTTVYASSTGKITICAPTTTVYSQSTTYCFPTASFYAPGVYSYGAKTVTITSSNQAYTCPYEQRIYPVTSTPGYPMKPASTPSYPMQSAPGYPQQSAPGYPMQSSPAYPTGSKPSVPPYPMGGNGTYPTGNTPASTPVYPVYPVSTPGYPVKPATTTPCTLEKKPSPTPYNNNGYNMNSYPAPPASYPAPPASYPAPPASYPAPPASYPPSYPMSTPPASYPTPPTNNYQVVPPPPASTPCPTANGGYAVQTPSY